ncbi:TPA: hypothetical protein DCW38_06840 [candidate division WOR-3 bacterium]|uniref:Uncharacterized protein n=1 Tax=candidate division WOR-3 bacterium TaxID=2052148 RepID=A0A350HBG4_UNCW3|nr:hypothetical protein [candidate division WOR-3 bacterium]
MNKPLMRITLILMIFIIGLDSAELEIAVIEKSKGMAFKLFEEQREILKRGDIIKQSENIQTGSGAYTKIRFIDNDGFIFIGGESDAILSLFLSDENSEKVFSLKKGIIYASTKNFSRIETQGAVILFDSSEVYVESSEDTLKVFCISGNAQIESAWGEAFLKANEEAVLLDELTPYKTNKPEKRITLIELESQPDLIEVELENSKMEKRNIILEVE